MISEWFDIYAYNIVNNYFASMFTKNPPEIGDFTTFSLSSHRVSLYSDLRELMYLLLSKRFHLLAFLSTCSSLITRIIISEKVVESVSNPSERTWKFISCSKFFWISFDFASIIGVSFWIFSQRLPKA